MFKVGQKLWFVSSHRHQQDYEATVLKVGRVWAHLDYRLRCDSSGKVDGGAYSSPGHCYVSREAYQLKKTRQEAWDKFRTALERKQMPESLTIEALGQISASLEIEP